MLFKDYNMYLKEFPAMKNPAEERCEVLWDTTPQQLYHTLHMFHQGQIPSEDFSIADMEHLIRSCISEQCGPGEFIVIGGSWSLIGTDWPAPSDVRVDLVFFPTYLVISILTLFWYRYPERARNIHGFQEALHAGLNFAAARKLFGHGMEGDEQRLEALKILRMGEVPRYLDAHKDEYPICRALYEVMIECKEDIYKQYFQISQDIHVLYKMLSKFS